MSIVLSDYFAIFKILSMQENIILQD